MSILAQAGLAKSGGLHAGIDFMIERMGSLIDGLADDRNHAPAFGMVGESSEIGPVAEEEIREEPPREILAGKPGFVLPTFIEIAGLGGVLEDIVLTATAQFLKMKEIICWDDGVVVSGPALDYFSVTGGISF